MALLACACRARYPAATVPRLESIHVYPVKSCRGVEVASWELGRFGLRHDRSWMVVDGAGRFLTQRELPALALVATRFAEGGLVLEAPGREPLRLPLVDVADDDDDRVGTGATGTRAPEPAEREVEVWRHQGPARDAGEIAARWISAHLGCAARLVGLAARHARPVSAAWFAGAADAAFSDGYPLLLLSQASIDDLGSRLPKPLPVDRFRPNLVVSGCAPYAEDLWKRIRIGDVELAVVKPCSRCAITTTEQTTGERDGTEPLRTLATYRKTPLGVVFGQNVVHLARGTLHAGDRVEVLASRSALRLDPRGD